MDSSLKFNVEHTCGSARAGVLVTPHGQVPTPAFMPVATQGSVKALGPDEVEEIGARIVLANAYHLYLRPGVGLIRKLGGLHAFSGWEGPMLTDSGGFQAFSLGGLGRMTDDGILFRSHIDGSEHLFTPESSIRDQVGLGADIIMCLDQCIASSESREAVRLAMDRTHRWALRCRDARRDYPRHGSGALFGIVQGGVFEDMRQESAEYVTSLDFDGYAVGGLAVGESKAEMYGVAELVAKLLPRVRPRYLMGVGSPEDLVECVYRGIDMFDCALPTRVARNGALYTPGGQGGHHQRTVPGCARSGPGRLQLLRLPPVFGGLPAPSVQDEGDLGAETGVHAQSSFHPEVDGGHQAGHRRGEARGLSPRVPGRLHTYGRRGQAEPQGGVDAGQGDAGAQPTRVEADRR